MKKLLIIIFLIILIYTRFVNLGWGLPYPFHPDERNMAAALQQLACREFEISNFKFLNSECFNPHFFAYGQFPLYLGYILVKVYHFFFSSLDDLISFTQAVMALRIISAAASVINVLVMVKIIDLINPKTKFQISKKIAFLIFIFSPALIQFAHFGTTESLLMLFYSVIVYLSLLFLNRLMSLHDFIKWSAAAGGLAVGTKVSSLIFVVIPVFLIFTAKIKKRHVAAIEKIKGLIVFTAVFSTAAVLSSPYNLIAFGDFVSSMRYETVVGLGQIQVFYTRQFFETVPIVFQFINIFPYALGWIALILFIGGFFILPYNKNYNILRLSFLIYFIFNAFLFTKWTRFMAPVFPIMLVMALLFVYRISYYVYRHTKYDIRNTLIKLAFYILILSAVLPGVAYLSVYNNEDVRVTASKWIYNNIPPYSYILSEGGNVVDIPFSPQNPELITHNFKYNIVSFDFYNLDENRQMQYDLAKYIQNADYVFVPSRRVFANHKKNYPQINQYYNDLFSGNLGLYETIKFSSYPKISIFNKTLLEFKDEQAEETWSVFDHPVIRIYQRYKS